MSSATFERVVTWLSKLAETGRRDIVVDDVSEEIRFCCGDTSLSDLCLLIREEEQTESAGQNVWQALTAYAVPSSNISRAIQAGLDHPDAEMKSLAAAIYVLVLCTKGCPVFSLFDGFSMGKALKLAKDTLCGKMMDKKCEIGRDKLGNTTEHPDTDEETDVQNSTPRGESRSKIAERTLLMLEHVAPFLRATVLRELPDDKRSITETLVDIFHGVSGPMQASAVKSVACALGELLQPHHGNVQETAALIMRLLAPGLWNSNPNTRKMTLEFMRTALSIPDAVIPVSAAARHSLLHTPEKADARNVISLSITDLMGSLPESERHLLVWFLARLSRSNKATQRLLAVQVTTQILETNDSMFQGISQPGMMTAVEQGNELNSEAAPLGIVCLSVLLQRCSDKHASVRGKALQGVTAAVNLMKSNSPSFVLKVLATCSDFPLSDYLASQLPETQSDADTNGAVHPECTDDEAGAGIQDTEHQAQGDTREQIRAQNNLSCSEPSSQAVRASIPTWDQRERHMDVNGLMHDLMKMVHRRVADEKAPVRKQAVLLLEALLFVRAENGCPPEKSDIAAVEAATSDALVSVRRSGLSVASSMLQRFPLSCEVATMWVCTALPLIRDADQALQEQLLDEFCTLILQRCTDAGATDRRSGEPTEKACNAVKSLRPIAAAIASGGALITASMSRAVYIALSKRRLKAKPVCAGLEVALVDFMGQAQDEGGLEAQGAWKLLIDISAQDPNGPSWEFLQDQWDKFSAQSEASAAQGLGQEQAALLRVIANTASSFPDEQAAKLAHDLMRALKGFRLPPAAASAHVQAVANLAKGQHVSADWARQLYKAAEAELEEYTSPAGRDRLRIVSAVPKGNRDREDSPMCPEDFRAITALFTSGELAVLRLSVRVPDRLLVLTQALTAPHIVAEAAAALSVAPTDPSSDAAEGPRPELPPAVQAHTWTALGKMCLADKALAKKCLPLFVQELGRSSLPAVRNNIVMALADMCVHFTALVDAHVPRIAACIRDPAELVRRQTLAVLTHLLQKDFVKWRGVLFHRFLLSLVDPSPAVVHIAEYLLGNVLGSKASLLSYNHFVEAMFVLNNCKAGMHAAAIAAVAAGPTEMHTEGLFTLRGAHPDAAQKRHKIYKVLLNHMQPEHKFATASKLCHEVLQAVADGVISLEDGGDVLRDALVVMGSKEIKVNVSKASTDEDAAAPMGEEGGSADAVGAIKRGLVSGMMKKHLVEAVVPVLIELKRQLEAERHPLIKELRECFLALLKDYKSEIEDILVGDKQLAKEILYDMKEQAAAESRELLPHGDQSGSEQASVRSHGAATPVQTSVPPPNGVAPAVFSTPQGLPAGVTAATPLAASVLAGNPGPGPSTAHKIPATAPRFGVVARAVSGEMTPGRGPQLQVPMSVPRLTRRTSKEGAGAHTPVSFATNSQDASADMPTPVVRLPKLDSNPPRQWNIPPEAAAGTPARTGHPSAAAETMVATEQASGAGGQGVEQESCGITAWESRESAQQEDAPGGHTEGANVKAEGENNKRRTRRSSRKGKENEASSGAASEKTVGGAAARPLRRSTRASVAPEELGRGARKRRQE